MGKVDRCDIFADAPCNIKQLIGHNFYNEVIYTHHTYGKAKACKDVGEDHMVITILSFTEHASLKVDAEAEIRYCNDERRERKG